jgi:hypothetical protein
MSSAVRALAAAARLGCTVTKPALHAAQSVRWATIRRSSAKPAACHVIQESRPTRTPASFAKIVLQAATKVLIRHRSSSSTNTIKYTIYTIAGSMAQSSCERCSEGKSSIVGQTSCTLCSPGMSSGLGDLTCSRCDSGQYNAVDGAGCTDCEDGTYSKEGARVCTSCRAGRYGSYPNASSSEADYLGPTAPQVDSSHCAACLPGFYQDQIAQSACKVSRLQV